jgi:hypothetical protein
MINSVSKIIIISVLFLSSCADRDLFTGPGINPGLGGSYTEISGTISGTLKKNNSPFLITENLKITANDTLTIEPGVKLYFKDGVRFNLNGSIKAVGTKELPIVFTAFLNDWEGIQIVAPIGESKFQFCTIERVYLPQENQIKYGAVNINTANVEFNNCLFQYNYVQYGGALALETASVTVVNSIFYRNESVAYGGAILSERSSNKIINNTFYQNYCLNYGGGIVFVEPVNEELQNNIFFDNHSFLGDPRIEIISGDSANVSEQYNFLAFGMMNPLFISTSDFHLSNDSPCIDAGNPEPQCNDSDGTRNDQGAYGGPDGDW